MRIFEELNRDNFLLYAAKYYNNPGCTNVEEFKEDLNRFKYIKRLFNRYEQNGDLQERLILNHLIVVFNSFGIEAALKILELKLDDRHWPVIKPFLIFLRYITNDDLIGYEQDKNVIKALRKI